MRLSFHLLRVSPPRARVRGHHRHRHRSFGCTRVRESLRKRGRDARGMARCLDRAHGVRVIFAVGLGQPAEDGLSPGPVPDRRAWRCHGKVVAMIHTLRRNHLSAKMEEDRANGTSVSCRLKFFRCLSPRFTIVNDPVSQAVLCSLFAHLEELPLFGGLIRQFFIRMRLEVL